MNGEGVMPTNIIKSFFNIISIIGFLTFVFLICSMFVLLNTGELVLEGKIYPAETFESDFTLNDTKDLTLVIHAVNSESTELLNINIMNSDGDVVFSEKKNDLLLVDLQMIHQAKSNQHILLE